jgi:multimeric flavodoxin WrbA
MKVLAIIGSPKGKGNSYKVTRELEKQINNYKKLNLNIYF